jgi:hypothetical protein
VFGFVAIPGRLVTAILVVTVSYVVATELQKNWFYRRSTISER